MKRFIGWILLAVLLNGCRWDGNALFGEDPDEKFEQVLHPWASYDLCREQKVVVDRVENAANCATPSELDSYFREIRVIEGPKLRLRFGKMWDGTFPKLVQLKYRTKGYSNVPPVVEVLACQAATGGPDERTYECAFKNAVEYPETHYFAEMELGHDTCAARAVFKGDWHFPICKEQSSYEFYGVYWKGYPLPELSESKKEKP